MSGQRSRQPARQKSRLAGGRAGKHAVGQSGRASGPATDRTLGRDTRRAAGTATGRLPGWAPRPPGRRRTARRQVGDRGSASIWAVGGIAVLFLVMAAVLAVGAVVQTRHRVAGAADLAALAAAAYAPDGETAACGRARWVTDRMRVGLLRCRLSGWDALIEVSASAPGDLRGFGPVAAHARAGPADG